MKNMKTLLDTYIKTWLQCNKCQQMCKIEFIDTSYSDDIICIYCKELMDIYCKEEV